MSKQIDILAGRANETDEEQRLREALNRHASSFMATLDAALQLRNSSSQVQRMRAMSRSSLQDACMRAMEAQAINRND